MGLGPPLPVFCYFQVISSTASPAGPFFLYRQKEGKERLKGFIPPYGREIDLESPTGAFATPLRCVTGHP